jgi:uncharacterized protein
MHPPSKPDSATSWPSARAALGDVYASDWLRRVKYGLRRLATSRHRAIVMEHLSRSLAARTLLAHAPRAFYPVMHKHLDRRFDGRQRAVAMVESIRCIEQATSRGRADELFRGDLVTLGTLPDATRICLNLNRLTFHEGLWALDLASPDGERLFTISFGMPDGATLMIGCVQGPPRSIDGLQCARDLTNTAEGLRPAHLLMAVLRTCARLWGVRRVIGAGEPFQVKGRWNHRATERMFDYQLFWTEVGGTQQGDGNWDLPLAVPQRPIEDVPSKRRAMYRRRYALLEALTASVEAALKPPADAGVSPRP